jgi:secreted Zn-dependent insulinase-like peptidase
MPRAVVHIVFIVPNLFNSPKMRAFMSVYTDALIEKVTAEIGYEAVLSDIAYSIKSFENLGYKLKFSGYNDKLLDFIKIFLEIMVMTQLEGFDEVTIKLAIEKSIKSYKNLNVEVDQCTTNNRLIFLFDQVYHAS